MNGITENLQALIVAAGVSETTLASVAGVPQSTVHRIASGASRTPREAVVERLAAAVGVSPELLRYGSRDEVVAAADLSALSNAGRSVGVRPAQWMETLAQEVEQRKATPWRAIADRLDRARVLAVHAADPDAPDPGDVFVPVVDARLGAGDGSPALELVEVDRSIAYRAAYLQRRGAKAEQCVVFKAAGRSMEPTVADGDLVLIDTARQRVTDGDVFAVMVAGVPKIKRLRMRPDGGLVILSDNPAFPPEPVEPDQVGDLVRIIGRAISRSGDL